MESRFSFKTAALTKQLDIFLLLALQGILLVKYHQEKTEGTTNKTERGCLLTRSKVNARLRIINSSLINLAPSLE